MRQISAKWLQMLRITGVLMVVSAVAGFTAAADHEIGLHFGSYRFISIGNAAIQVGMNQNRFVTGLTESPRGFYIRQAWNRDWAMAWRPFHAMDSWQPAKRSWHMLVFPLWPLMPIGAAIAAYSHGMLKGMRRISTGECWSCGYDLRKTPVVAGQRTCPECGLSAAVENPTEHPAEPPTT